MRTFKETHSLVIKLGREKGIIKAENKESERTKLIEELGEVAAELIKGDKEALKMEIGDVLVVLTMISEIEDHGNRCRINRYLRVDIDPVNDKIKYFNRVVFQELMHWDRVEYGILFAKDLGFDPTECYNLAYDKIKNRQ